MDNQTEKSKKSLRIWLNIIPGNKVDYSLLTFASLDLLGLMFGTSYIGYLPDFIGNYILAFDYFVISIWGIHSLLALRKSKDRKAYFQTHWYEFIGLIPLAQLRIFLLLRALKLAIVYYKLGTSEQNVSRLRSRDFSFRFRDVIVDTIADAVFLQSLRRVEEVMLRLDYNKLSHDVLSKHEDELRTAICRNIENNSFIGDLKKIPLMSPLSRGLGNSVADAGIELMQQKVLGEIFQDITATILSDMHTSLKELDLVRITTSGDYKILRHSDDKVEVDTLNKNEN